MLLQPLFISAHSLARRVRAAIGLFVCAIYGPAAWLTALLALATWLAGTKVIRTDTRVDVEWQDGEVTRNVRTKPFAGVAILYYTILYYTILYYTLLYYTILYYA